MWSWKRRINTNNSLLPVAGRRGAPPSAKKRYVHIKSLDPVNKTLFGKSILTDEINALKLKPSSIIQLGNLMTSHVIRKRQREIWDRRKENTQRGRPCDHRGRGWREGGARPPGKLTAARRGERRSVGSPQSVQHGSSPRGTCTSNLGPPELQKNTFLLF